MKILVIHQYFLEKDGAGGSRFNEFCKFWSLAGHNVTVIAGNVDYASGEKKKKYVKKWIVKEKGENNVMVLRCFVASTYNKSFLGRLWGYVSFTLSSCWAVIFYIRGYDVVIATSPPLYVAFTGYLASRIMHIPLIFEVRDLWPKFAIDLHILKNKAYIRFAYWLEDFIYRKSALINVLTPAFEEYLINEKKVQKEKIIYIPNGADLDLCVPSNKKNLVREKYAWGEKFIILYTGAHGVANDLWHIINVAEKIADKYDILFVLIGNGMEKVKLELYVKEKNISNVQFLNSVPKNEITDYINAADVCTAILDSIFTTTFPNKVFDYMACAKPIILPIDGVVRKLVVDEAGAGIFVEPKNCEKFIQAIDYLKNNKIACDTLGMNGYEFVKEHFDRSKLANSYLNILKKLVYDSQSRT